ncbi:MAG: ankyrin repeat domain-containing protein [Proteobacteria bacterium]|nr:ankyrin repeat domain-containing protein [Pseudomonadota bacterium]
MNFFRISAVAIVGSALCTVAPTNAPAAKMRICQEQDQHYEQVRASAGPLELNAALSAAADKGCLTLAQRLLDDGASLGSRDRQGAMPLSHAAMAGHTDILDLFIAHGAAINARNLDGSTALFVAAEQDNQPAIESLVAHGADVNLAGRSGLTPLEAAAYMGNENIAKLLLAKGADPKRTDATGKGPICYAAARGFAKVADILLDHSVDVNARYGNDLTALMWAAGHEDGAGTNDVADVLTLLISRGAHLDDRDNRGRTALMIAASLGHERAVDVLLAHGASRTMRDKSGKTASDLASNDELKKKLTAG